MQKYKTVDEFLNDLEPEKRHTVDILRQLILATNTSIEEHIKWNAPSYVVDGEDRITFNIMNKQEVVKLVLHMGATRKEDKKGTPVLHDESGLIEWSSDIRGTITFATAKSVSLNINQLKTIVSNWLTIPATNK